MEDFIGKYDGNQIDSRLDKVKDMVGATASGAGAAGLVPAPAKGDEGRFLCGDGTWKDAVAKSDDEDAFLAIILQLAGDQSTTLPQSQYNTIKSLFDGSSTSNVRMIRPNNSFVEALGGVNINDLMVFNDQMNDCITIYISGSNTILGMGFMDISISVYPNLSVGYIHSNFDNQLHLKMKGKGDKALMDDGTYKEIGSSGVDISSYILEGIDFKKNTTKEGFDKIKSCVINKQHMYLYFYNAVGDNEASFYADVIAGALYGSLNLCVYDFSSSKIVNVDIKSQDYSITVNTQ